MDFSQLFVDGKGGQEWLCDPNYYKYKFEAFDEERVFALKKRNTNICKTHGNYKVASLLL